jgi:hypothetical protein
MDPETRRSNIKKISVILGEPASPPASTVSDSSEPASPSAPEVITVPDHDTTLELTSSDEGSSAGPAVKKAKKDNN